jgi:hypothetical protein
MHMHMCMNQKLHVFKKYTCVLLSVCNCQPITRRVTQESSTAQEHVSHTYDVAFRSCEHDDFRGEDFTREDRQDPKHMQSILFKNVTKLYQNCFNMFTRNIPLQTRKRRRWGKQRVQATKNATRLSAP